MQKIPDTSPDYTPPVSTIYMGLADQRITCELHFIYGSRK